jgi:hypothetical protein
VWVLAVRNVKFYMRNPELMLAKLFTYIFMGGFMGERLCFIHAVGFAPAPCAQVLDGIGFFVELQ